MKTVVERLKNNILIKYLLVAVILSFLVEISIFNYSSWRSIGLVAVPITGEISTDETGMCEISRDIECLNIRNFRINNLKLENCSSADVTIRIADEGDAYLYELPTFRVTDEVESTGFTNIYPYGRVNKITVAINVPEGGKATISGMDLNVRRPFDIKFLRVIILSVLIWVLIAFWKKEESECWQNGSNATDNDTEKEQTELVNTPRKRFIYKGLARKDKKQAVVIVLVAILLILLGRWMNVSNEKIVSCPWPHHKQYQELAVALSNGTVKLVEKEVSPLLLEKENPYDTGALMAEEIPYQMDYAYYNGSYYVYFGIAAEILLYYPYYIITGKPLSNYNAQYLLYLVLVFGVFMTMREMCFKFGTDNGDCNESKISLITYLVLCTSAVLISNNVYLISRSDIYNIPIMAATAFTWTGIFFWLRSYIYREEKTSRCISICLGSLCMALVAGCRPQMLFFSVLAIFIFVLCSGKNKAGISITNRKLFTRDTLCDTLCFIVPYIVVAVVVCWYNQARFDSILDFGATYSLTSNDMNHRGFNFDRLFKGLFAFFLQPPVLSMDFPYLDSSVLKSDYMGKNLTEFVYGGCFVTNLMLLSVFVPIFSGFKGFKADLKAIYLILVVGVVVIAAFDVNGAGVLYRYTCDFVPGLMLASYIIWIVILGREKLQTGNRQIVERVFIICVIWGLIYSFMVFMGTSGSISLKNDSIYLYEHIREYFRL